MLPLWLLTLLSLVNGGQRPAQREPEVLPVRVEGPQAYPALRGLDLRLLPTQKVTMVPGGTVSVVRTVLTRRLPWAVRGLCECAHSTSPCSTSRPSQPGARPALPPAKAAWPGASSRFPHIQHGTEREDHEAHP